MTKKRFILSVLVGILLLVLFVSPVVYTFSTTQQHRYDLSQNMPDDAVPYHRVALVFGAGITPDGRPTPYLENRIRTAVELYENKRVSKILMSGDNSTEHHNEPVVMKRAAMQLGVPAEDITVDYAGFSTYDSCYRAKEIFGLSDAALVTQAYHLPRAMVACKGVGVQNIGVSAQSQGRDYTLSYLIREVFSTHKMLFQYIVEPKPAILGKPEPIN